MLWTSYFLWSFVFGWFEQYSGHPVFVPRFPVRWWLTATVLGVAGAWIAVRFVDPMARKLTPQDYPANTGVWFAMTVFTLAFDQLFLCFAPVSFFERLIHRRKAALIGTVIFVMTVGALKIVSSPVPPPAELTMAILAWRFAGSIISTVLFYRGGVVLVWWWILVFQLRLLISLST